MSADKLAVQKVRLVIVEDHPIVIQGLKSLLANETSIELSGTFTTASGFMSWLKKHPVDVILLDIILPDANGIDLCPDIKKAAPDAFILALSNHAEKSIIQQALHSGAHGYLLKNAPEEELLSCIHQVMKGEITLSGEVREILSRAGLDRSQERPRITKREKQILQLIAEGKTSTQMAEELFLSPLTVETHRRNLLQKFDAKNVAELIVAAVHQQFL